MPRIPKMSEHFQQKCFDNNIHNQLVHAITTIDFQNETVKNDLNAIIKALNLLMGKNPDKLLRYVNFKSAGKTVMTKNGTVIDLGDMFKKALDETQASGNVVPPVGSRHIEQNNIIILCLLYLNNFEFLEFDKNLDALMVSLADESNSQFIIWCLLAILDKLGNDEFAEELLPTWIPISFISTSNNSICRKIVDSLTQLVQRTPNLFFKESNFEKFWETVKDGGEVMKLEDVDNLEDSLFGALLGLADAPIFSEDPNFAQYIITVACDILDKADIVNIDKKILCQLLQKLLDILKVTHSEKSIFDLFKATEKVLSALAFHRYDYKTVSDKLTRITEKNRKAVNNCLRENHKEIFLILSKSPHLLDFDTKIVHLEDWLPEMDEQSKLELVRECMQLLESQIVENGAQLFSSLEQLFQSLETDGYDISQETENVVQCAKNHSENFNTFAMENDSDVLISMLITTEDVMNLAVKIKYTSVAITGMTEPLIMKFLSECLQKLEEERLDQKYQKEIMETVELLFKSIYSSEYKPDGSSINLEEFLTNHADTINTVLRKFAIPEWFCKVLSPSADSLLDDDVKIIQLDILIDYVDDIFRENMLMNLLEAIESSYTRVEEPIRKLLMDWKQRDERHQTTFASILRKHHISWIYVILTDYPKLLPLDVKIRYSNETMSNSSISTLWDLLSQCIHQQANQSHIGLPLAENIVLTSFTERLFAQLTNMEDFQTTFNIRTFAESHKTQLNKILRQDNRTLNPLIFKEMGNIPTLFDFDVNLKFVLVGVKIWEESTMLELLSDCFDEYETSRYGVSREQVSFAIIQLSLHIRNIVNQFYQVAENHRDTVNTILRESTECLNAGLLCSLCWQYLNFLELDVKCLYVTLNLVQLTLAGKENLLKECVDLLTNLGVEEYILNFLSTIDSMLRVLDYTVSDIIKDRLVQFAERHKSVINNFFRTEEKYIHLVEVLIYEPNLLDFDIKLDNVNVLSVVKNPTFFWNFASECLLHHEELSEDDNIEIKRHGQAIVLMFSSVNISGRDFHDFFENHRYLLNSILRRCNQLELFILLVPYLSKIDTDVKIKYVKSGCEMLYLGTKEAILDDIFLNLANSPSKETVAEFLPTVEILFSSLEKHEKDDWKDRLMDFASKNLGTLNDVLLGNVVSYKTGTLIAMIYQLLSLDVKLVYIESLMKALDKTQLLDLLSEILSSISSQNQYSDLLRTAINELSQVLTKKAIGQKNMPYSKFAAQHSDTIKHLLNADFDKSLFLLLAPFPKYLEFDMKVKFLNLFLKTNSKKSHWELLVECVEHYIRNPTTGLLEPISDIIRSVISTKSWKPEYRHLNFAEKYMDTLNQIMARDNSTIITFLSYFPQLISFDNKLKFMSVIRSKMSDELLAEFVKECLEALKCTTLGFNVAEICKTLFLCIDFIRTSSSWGTGVLNRLADEYPEELKKVVDLMGCGKGPSWRLILNKLGIMDFETKVKYLREQLDREMTRGETIELKVNRSDILSSSYFHLNSRSLSEWKCHFKIKFENENGVDAGGLMREWFTILTREIFNPNYALFTIASDDNNSYTINKASHVNPEHLDYFKFVGRFIGKSVLEKQFVDCPFTKSLYKHILDIPVGFKDFEIEDPIYCNSLNSLLNHPISDLGLDLTFTTEIEEFGMISEKELVEDGKNIEVTDENKKEYVRLLCQMKMTGSIRHQLDSFLSGFYDMISKHLILGFSEKELELLICGEQDIDIDDLEANAEYDRYNKRDTHIQWFWQAFRSFDKDDKAKLLMFVTGSSKAPPGGFASNPSRKFVISKGYHGDSNRLPSAHTCAQRLVLPQYESYDRMRQAILTAIREGGEGFGFS